RSFFLLLLPPPPSVFPYTTLFRSARSCRRRRTRRRHPRRCARHWGRHLHPHARKQAEHSPLVTARVSRSVRVRVVLARVRGVREIGRAHVCTPVTLESRMPSSA